MSAASKVSSARLPASSVKSAPVPTSRVTCMPPWRSSPSLSASSLGLLDVVARSQPRRPRAASRPSRRGRGSLREFWMRREQLPQRDEQQRRDGEDFESVSLHSVEVGANAPVLWIPRRNRAGDTPTPTDRRDCVSRKPWACEGAGPRGARGLRGRGGRATVGAVIGEIGTAGAADTSSTGATLEGRRGK